MAQINKPNTQFNTKLWSGNSTTSTGITGINFQPDLVWIKNRTDVNSHALFDNIRGATNYIESDTADAEATNSEFLQSFDSDGFTLGNAGRVNFSGNNYVGWSWKAGGTTASNTDGSITSTVSANTTSGFSIVSWTGSGANATIGHSLGAVPKMIIIRRRTGSTTNWIVYHESIGNNNELFLNLTNASTSSTRFQSTSPTSSVFSVSSNSAVNESSQSHIAYCFAEKKGFSKFGSYTGNGNADGTFVYTGFKPAWVMIKRSSGTQSWVMFDNKRSSFNATNDLLFTNTSGAESVDNSVGIDCLSQGFKCRSADDSINSGSYIYMAFAESPLVGTNNIPSVAR